MSRLFSDTRVWPTNEPYNYNRMHPEMQKGEEFHGNYKTVFEELQKEFPTMKLRRGKTAFDQFGHAIPERDYYPVFRKVAE